MWENPETGKLEPLGGTMEWSHQCPRCGQKASPLNAYVAREGDLEMYGFADTPEEAQLLHDAIVDLRRLPENATVEDALQVLEQHGERFLPVVAYLREHAIELASLGVAIGSLVVALLMYLNPSSPAEPWATPQGITVEQMQRLVDDLEAQIAEKDDHEAQQTEEQGGPE